MSAATTLFQLKSDNSEMFDGSVNGITIVKARTSKYCLWTAASR